MTVVNEPPESIDPAHPPAPPISPAPPLGVWESIREALRGSHHDYTTGSIRRAIFLLAVPMVLEMVMESIFAVVDVFFVSRLGANAVATVGLTESMMAIIYTVAMGLSIGATAVVARRVGERDPEAAAHAAVQAVALGFTFAVLLGITGIVFAPRLLAAMGATPEVIATGSTFTRVMLGGNATVLLLFLVNAIFRGAGDAAIAMRTLWLANAINIVLGPCLIFGLGPFPALGVTGAAIATNIGRGTGALYALSRLVRRGGRVHVQPKHMRLEPRIMLQMLRLSGSGTIQVLIGTMSWIGLVRILSTFGSDALAGYTIAIRIVLFVLLPAWGLSNAAATMVGQALGAKNPDRAERAVWQASKYNFFLLGGVGLLFVVFGKPIASIFAPNPAVLGIASDALRIIALGFPLYAYGMVLSQSFNGAGDTRTPTYLNLFVFWLGEIPAAYYLAKHTALGQRGVFLAITIAFSAFAIASGVLFRRGRWKTRVV
jgi:MATE family, multidrug efflux pump